MQINYSSIMGHPTLVVWRYNGIVEKYLSCKTISIKRKFPQMEFDYLKLELAC